MSKNNKKSREGDGNRLAGTLSLSVAKGETSCLGTDFDEKYPKHQADGVKRKKGGFNLESKQRPNPCPCEWSAEYFRPGNFNGGPVSRSSNGVLEGIRVLRP